MFRTKFVHDEIKVVSEAEATVDAIVSSESKDRDGDVIRVAGWELGKFNAHPVLLDSHNYLSTRSQIGEWVSMKVIGKRLIGRAKYYIDSGNDAADWAWQLAKRGVAAYSVGFIPDFEKATPIEQAEPSSQFSFTPMEFNGQELLEVSQVTVPSNSDALQRVIKGQGACPPALRDFYEDLLADDTYGESEDLEAKRLAVAAIPIELEELAEILMRRYGDEQLGLIEERMGEIATWIVKTTLEAERARPAKQLDTRDIRDIVTNAVFDGLEVTSG